MKDVTLLYYTCNLSEPLFMENIRKELLSFGLPIISVSHKPIDFGHNICVGDIGVSIYNIYRQVLLGAKEAKTPYIICCEDDTLYNIEHLSYRPPEDSFAYNINRWNVNEGLFFHRNRANMSMCIAPTKLMIGTLERRFEKFPRIMSREEMGAAGGFGEPGKFEKKYGLPEVKMERFNTKIPTLVFNHRPSVGGVRKISNKDTVVRALPYWGDARELWERMWERS